MQEFYILSDGIKLHAKLEMPEGAGEPEIAEDGRVVTGVSEKYPLFILIHGFTGHMEEAHILAAKETARKLGMAALRVEMFGHGKSEGRFQDHTLYKWITNGLSVVDYAKALPFVSDIYLSGHSQGGLLVMVVGGMKHQDLKAILPLSPAWMIPEMARRGTLLGNGFDPVNIPDTLDNGELILDGNYLRVAQTIHVEDFFDKFTKPVFIVHGDEDEAVPVSYAYKANELYQNPSLTIIPGDDHCFTRHLDQMTAALEQFLKGQL